ncbi:hypothetical protein AAC387_Pa05g3618 [Persea americana]
MSEMSREATKPRVKPTGNPNPKRGDIKKGIGKEVSTFLFGDQEEKKAAAMAAAPPPRHQAPALPIQRPDTWASRYS